MMQQLIPLYCLTGFVGSGKTTVLLRILKQYPNKKIGVIFTEPAIYFKEEQDIIMEQLENGSAKCICSDKDLAKALEKVGATQPEMVFVEVAGLSDPLNTKKVLQSPSNTFCIEHYDLKGIICLVDADNFMEQIQDVDMVRGQLTHCNLAVINKADLVAPELLNVLIAQIRRINPNCEIASCSFGGFSLDLLDHDLLSCNAEESDSENQNLCPDSIVLNCNKPLQKEKVTAFLERFQSETYRIKGFCLLEDGWNQVDSVGSRLNFTPCSAHTASRLIFISKIGHALSDSLCESWEEMIGLPMQLHD